MEFLRPGMSRSVLTAAEVENAKDGDTVQVAGWPIARQHPRGESGTVFVTIEDETADVQLILWPQVFARFRDALRSHVILATGKVSRWDDTTNVMVSHLQGIEVPEAMPRTHDWR